MFLGAFLYCLFLKSKDKKLRHKWMQYDRILDEDYVNNIIPTKGYTITAWSAR
jgi:hypothetical protein